MACMHACMTCRLVQSIKKGPVVEKRERKEKEERERKEEKEGVSRSEQTQTAKNQNCATRGRFPPTPVHFTPRGLTISPHFRPNYFIV